MDKKTKKMLLKNILEVKKDKCPLSRLKAKFNNTEPKTTSIGKQAELLEVGRFAL